MIITMNNGDKFLVDEDIQDDFIDCLDDDWIFSDCRPYNKIEDDWYAATRHVWFNKSNISSIES